MSRAAASCWLMKSEPEVYSIDDLAKNARCGWEGVRNYQARNSIREMGVGDHVLYYHSNADPSGVYGVARVSKAAYPDPFQFDPKSEFYDAASKKDDPRWSSVEIEFVEKLQQPVTLEAMKADAALATMVVVQKGSRLSVTPVSAVHFNRVVKLGNGKSKA